MQKKDFSLRRVQKRHATRQRVQKSRQRRRLYPFSDETKLKDLFRPECQSRINILARELKPYLIPCEGNARQWHGLFFEPEALRGHREDVYRCIAKALQPWKDGKSPLSVPKNVFFRYLADKAHCNLGIVEKLLHSLCIRKLQR